MDGIRRLAQVDARLWRSGRYTAAGLARMAREHGLRHVVDLRDAGRPRMLAPSTYRRVGVDYEREPVPEGGPVPRRALDAVRRLVTDGVTLVHCWRGVDRTGIVVAAYRVQVMGWSVADALSDMATAGPARPWALVVAESAALDRWGTV